MLVDNGAMINMSSCSKRRNANAHSAHYSARIAAEYQHIARRNCGCRRVAHLVWGRADSERRNHDAGWPCLRLRNTSSHQISREPSAGVTSMNTHTIWKKMRRVAWSTAQFGSMLVVGFGVFQVGQQWVDTRIDQNVLRWVLPTSLSVTSMVILGSAFLVMNIRSRQEQLPPPEALASAILGYGLQLHSEGRDYALISLRNRFSITLHILGFHDTRAKLGEVALRSAAVVADNATKAEVLVDDLGWANYLLGHEAVAAKNIERGVTIAAESQPIDAVDRVRLALCKAKGLRHLAIITCVGDLQKANAKLDEAMQTLQSQSEESSRDVKRDIAQIHHARALIAAMSLNIHKSGSVRAADAEGTALIDAGLKEVRGASSLFEEIGDLERYVKSLFLEVRLLEAKGADIEAREVVALRDRTLASSEWLRPEGIRTVTGV